MRKHTLTAIGTALLLSSAGIATAQTTSPNTTPGNTGVRTTAPGTTGAATTTSSFGQTLRGKDVVNLEGDSIGEVKSVQGDRLVVSVGGFLGIGERDVALSRSQVSVTGVGDDQKLVTSLTKDELKAMPEVAMDSNSRSGTATMPRDGDKRMTTSSDTRIPGAADSSATTTAFNQNLRGKDIENLDGDSIGEVKRVEGDRLVVSVGGFLGMGERDVALSRSQVTVTGVGDDQKLVTSLTEDELKAMPEVAMDSTPRAGTASTARDSGMTSPSNTQPMSTTAGNNTTTSANPSTAAGFNQTLRGKDVVNVEGDTIGEVKGIQGDNLVVSVGGFLGIGARDVALSRSQVSVTGVGDDQKLVTSLTKDELKAMPEVTMDTPRTGGTTPMPRDSGTTAPGGTRPTQ